MIRQTHRARFGRQYYLATAMTALFAWAGQANALPTGFSVAGPVGGAMLDSLNTATSMTVDQSSNRVVIDWSTFIINPGEQLKFAQPNKGSIAFNVIPAGAGVAKINGSLTANGGVWLFSPDGILFGAGSTVSTGSFLASTGVFNATSQAQALSGANTIDIFAQGTPGQGSITVQPAGCGTMPAEINADAGFVLLHSPTIDEEGSVTASDAVVYNADEDIQATFVPSASGIALTSETSDSGLPSASHITVAGSTNAGTWFEADAAEDVGGVINLSGTIAATGMKADTANPSDSGNGFSVILNGDDGGTSNTQVTSINASGSTIDASSGIYANAGSISTGSWNSTGGAVQLSAGGAGPTGGIDIDPPLISTGPGLVSLIGTNVTLDSDVIAAGSVLVLSHDITVGSGVTVEAGSSIPDSSLIIKSTGDIDADPLSQLFVGPALGTPTGALSVLAGATVGPQDSPLISQTNPGTGGDLTLGTANGSTITLQAMPLNGVGGTLDIENSVTASGSVFMSAAQLTLGGGGGIASGLSGSVIGPGEITSNSATTDVVLQNAATPAAVLTGAGDIVLGAPVNFASPDADLSLVAYHSIIVTGAINVSGSGTEVDLDPNFGGAGGDYSFTNGGSLSFTAGDDSQSLFINGNQYTLIYSLNGGPDQPGLLDINNNLGGNYALAVPLDFTTANTATVFTGAPIAPTTYAEFTGTFTGLGNTISNLNIQNVTPIGQFAPAGDSTNGAIGLFGFVGSGGVVRDINLANAQVSGGDGIWAGALVGDLEGTLMNASSSGQVSVGGDTTTTTGGDVGNFANAIAGGLVGYADGQIINAHSSATVTGGDAIAGGLVGQLDLTGSIANSSASGSVTVGDNTFSTPFVGGLVGQASGFDNNGPSLTITGSSATGAVTGGSNALVGGFVGDATETAISGSFATGAVQSGGGSAAGGFAGQVDQATITTSYATGSVTQTAPGSDFEANAAGGFVGDLISGSSITQSYSTGAVQTVGGSDNGAFTLAGGFAGDVDTNSSISNSYSLSPVSSTGAFADTGGFAGVVQGGSGIDHVYATGLVTGGGQNAGLVAVLGNPNDASNQTGSLSDSYWDTGTTGQSVGYHITPPATMADGEGTETAVLGISGTGVYSAATYGNFDFTNTWVVIPGVTRPMLQSEYSTTITNAHQLQLMETNLTASYTLANNIDASGTSSAAGTAGGLWNPATGFSPVGGNGEAAFTGTFNGQGYTISNLSIRFTTADLQNPVPSLTTDGVVGLFGFVGPTGVLENVNIANADVTGGNGMVVGALAGGVLGSVVNASSSGVITVGNEINTDEGITADAGGLVGASAGTITNSTSSATVIGGDAFAGGLLGSQGNGGLVADSSASGLVSVTSYPALGIDSPSGGGLIGEANNSTVAGSFATGDVSGGAGARIGGLLGSTDEASITTSYATGDVTQTAGGVAGSNSAAGGFVGSVNDGSTITQSWASGDVSSVAATTAGTFSHAGGFAGDLSDSGTSASEDYALGSVTMTGAGAAGVNRAGGFAGAVYNSASVNDVYATGLVTGATGVQTAGLVTQVGSNNGGGDTSGGTVTNSYWDEGTTGQTVGTNIETPSGGVVTNVIGIGGSTGLSPYSRSTYTSNVNPSDNFDFTSTWFMVEGSTRPILQSEYSTDITNAHQLQLMDMNLAANYTLGADIDASETSNPSGVWNIANGFVPVGASGSKAFTGSLNGQGYTISNLTIVDTTPVLQTDPAGYPTNGYVGLFGVIGSTGSVSNLALTNAQVTGGDGMYVGALAGNLLGTVSQVSTAGSVTGGNSVTTEDGNTPASVGGLVGGFDGVIQQASSSATVTGGDAFVGGLVGSTAGVDGLPGGTIINSFTTGVVTTGASTSTDEAVAGGLIGLLTGGESDGVSSVPLLVSDSYSTASVHGGAGSVAGGFVGYLAQSQITTSYATGPVTQGASTAYDSIAGGFVGYAGAGAVISQSFSAGSVSTAGAVAGNGAAYAGGFAGELQSGATVTNSYSQTTVTNTGGANTDLGGFAGLIDNGASASEVLATGHISGSGATGGLVGDIGDSNNNPGVIQFSYWDEGATGQAYATGVGAGTVQFNTGVAGESGPNPFDPGTYGYFNFATTWSPPSSVGGVNIYPQLYGVSHVLLITAQDADITYGNYPVYTLTITGLQGGDAASVVQNINATPLNTGIAYSGYYDVAYYGETPENVPPPYTLAPSASGASGGSGAYRIVLNDGGQAATDAGLSPGTLEVDPATLTLSTGGDIKTYDGSNDDPNANIYESGLVPGDGVSATAVFSQSDVGSEIPINIVGYTIYDGNEGSNYAPVNLESGTGEIDAESIVISAVSDTKQYDATTSSSQTPVVFGQFYGDDGVSGLTQSFTSKDVLGTNGSTLVVNNGYTISVADSDDYNISFASAPGTITPAPLTINAVTDSRTYDGYTDSAQTPTFDSEQVLGTDTVTGLSQAFQSKDVLGTNGSLLVVNGYTINDGNNGNDYTVTLNTAQGTITPAPLTINAVTDSRTYDGYTDSAQTPTFDPEQVLGTDTVTGLSQAFQSKDVLGTNGSTLAVNGYTINDGNNGADYTVTLNTALGTITPAPLTINAVTDTKQYDGGISSVGVPTADMLGADTLTATQTFESKDVLGTNGSTLEVNTYTINDGNNGADYTVTLNTAQGTITPAPLTINAVTDSRTYDGYTDSAQTPTFDSEQVLGTDTVTGLSQAFQSKDVLGTNGSTLVVNGYTINDGNNGNDYTVTLNTAQGTITPAPLTINAVTDSRTYDGYTDSSGTPTFDPEQVLGTDSVTGLSQAFASKDVLGTNGSMLVVNGYTINDGNNGNDYAVTLNTAVGTITPAPLTINAVTDTKQYDGGTSSVGVPTADTLGTDTLTATQAFDSKDVMGTNGSTLEVNGYTINDGNNGNDYTVTQVNTALGTITPAPLTASLVAPVTKTYDGDTDASLDAGNYKLSGVIGEDDVNLNDPTSGAYDNRNAGTGKTVTVAGLRITGEDSEDYALSSTTAAGPVGIITAAPLTLTAVTDTRTYNGGVSSTGTPTNSPLIEGDSISGLTQSFASKNVLGAGASTLLVTGYTIDDGNDGNNYAVTLVSARGTIDPAPLTIAAVTDTKTYDGTTASSATPSVVTLVGGDTISGLTETYGSKNAGAQTLSIAGYTINDGNDGNNYTVTTTTAAGEIDPKTLDVTLIGNVQKAYDGNTNATLTTSNYSLAGVVSGDNVSLNDPTSGTYDTPNAGTFKLVTVAGLAISGADAANYLVNGTAAGPVGTITAPPQTLQIVVPTQYVTLLGFLETAADSVETIITTTTTVVNVFPVGNDNNNGAQGDNLPITGTGNLDLWTTSEDSDQTCPPNTTCPTNGGSHP